MVYKWYILPIGGLYATYHLLREPETTIELVLQGFSATHHYVYSNKKQWLITQLLPIYHQLLRHSPIVIIGFRFGKV